MIWSIVTFASCVGQRWRRSGKHKAPRSGGSSTLRIALDDRDIHQPVKCGS